MTTCPWVDFEIVAHAPTDGSLYLGETHPVADIEEAEVLAEGSVKSDGCMELRTDAHTCRADMLDALLAAIREARKLAAKAMTSEAARVCIQEEYDER